MKHNIHSNLLKWNISLVMSSLKLEITPWFQDVCKHFSNMDKHKVFIISNTPKKFLNYNNKLKWLNYCIKNDVFKAFKDEFPTIIFTEETGDKSKLLEILSKSYNFTTILDDNPKELKPMLEIEALKDTTFLVDPTLPWIKSIENVFLKKGKLRFHNNTWRI